MYYKKKQRAEMLAEVSECIRHDADPEVGYILLSVQTFYDPISEYWVANVSYFED